MKIYLFYLKEDPRELYAFTLDKEYRDRFMNERNMDLFYMKKERIEKNICMVFMSKNKSKQIIKDVLNDGEKDYVIMCTMEESVKLSESCEYIENTCIAVRDLIHNYSLKKKYLKSIIALTDVIKNQNSNPTLQINSFKLFYELFKHTFYEKKENEN
jgi:hypothetical protein